MWGVGASIFYVTAMLLMSALHAEMHRRQWPNCKTCTSHSHRVSLGIAAYSLVIAMVAVLGLRGFDSLGVRVTFTYLIFILLGTIPIWPLGHWNIRPFPHRSPYLISSWSLFGFGLTAALIAASAVSLEQASSMDPAFFSTMTERWSPLVIGFGGGLAAALVVLLGNYFINPPSQRSSGRTSYVMFRHGQGYILFSVLVIIAGLVILVYYPLSTW
jgi:hypothetical protein